MSKKVINNSEDNLGNSSQFNGDFEALLANYKKIQKELQVQENKDKNPEDKITSLESANKTQSQYIAKLEFQQSKLLRLVFGSQSEKKVTSSYKNKLITQYKTIVKIALFFFWE